MAHVSYSYRVGIRVRVLGPTNNRGTRVRVWRSDCTYNEDSHALTLSWDHALNGGDNAVAAVDAYLSATGWHGQWFVAGANPSEYVAVWGCDR